MRFNCFQKPPRRVKFYQATFTNRAGERETIVQQFTIIQALSLGSTVDPDDGIPEHQALTLVNSWNRQALAQGSTQVYTLP